MPLSADMLFGTSGFMCLTNLLVGQIIMLYADNAVIH